MEILDKLKFRNERKDRFFIIYDCLSLIPFLRIGNLGIRSNTSSLKFEFENLKRES